MNFNNIISFHTIVESNNMTAAAQLLNISQPALSKSIKNLENDIGFSLFNHSRNKIILNKNGEMFYKVTKKMLSDYNRCITEIQNNNGIHSKKLTISLSSAGSIVPTLIHDFKTLYPDTYFSLKTYTPGTLDTESHFTFISSYHEINRPNYNLICKEPLYLTVGIKHKLSQYKKLNLRDLSSENFLFSDKNNDMYNIQLHFCEMAGFTPDTNNMFEKQNVMLTMIELNEGISLLPKNSERNIKQIPLCDISCFRYVYLIENEAVFRTNLADKFKRFCLKHT